MSSGYVEVFFKQGIIAPYDFVADGFRYICPILSFATYLMGFFRASVLFSK